MRGTLFVLLGAAFALSACSDDPAGPTGDRLTREEAIFLAGEVVSSGDLTTSSPEASADPYTLNLIPSTVTQDLQLTHPCPAGGQVQLNWSTTVVFDPETGDLVLDVAGRQTHAACAFVRQGITFTVDGNPNIQVDAHLEIDNHQPVGQHTLNVDGGFRWTTSDGRSGTCPVSLDAITNFATQTRTLQGNICGHTISETLTWS